MICALVLCSLLCPSEQKDIGQELVANKSDYSVRIENSGKDLQITVRKGDKVKQKSVVQDWNFERFEQVQGRNVFESGNPKQTIEVIVEKDEEDFLLLHVSFRNIITLKDCKELGESK